MISVLIPTYNYDSFDLVKKIHTQLIKSNLKFEIICFDDASSYEFNIKNEQINTLDFCQFKLLNKNVGRSKIRNLLADDAKYEKLLFIDGDVIPKNSTFIKDYLNKKEKQVFCGGVCYDVQKPKKTKLLRWVYGKKREEIEALKRNANSYRYFFSSNFLIDKFIFNKIRFNEGIIDYGYEDLVFSNDLKNNGIDVEHINNPVYHLGLEKNTIFLNKTIQSVKNLLILSRKNLLKKDEVKLLSVFLKLKSIRLTPLLGLFFKISKKIIEHNLFSKNPSLFLFDIYKLGYLCSIEKGK